MAKAKEPGTEVMSLEEQVKQQLAVQQQKSNEMQTKTNLISFKGGILSISGNVIPSGEIQCIVLATQYERAYYKGDFDASKTQIPACFSFDGIHPHPTAAEAQCATCDECPQNKWGSLRRGKACRESSRVMVMPTNMPIEAAPMYQASFPITSMGTVKSFLDRCASAGKLTAQYFVRLSVVPDAASFFKATLTPLEQNNLDLAELLKQTAKARALLIEPYPVIEPQEAPAKNTKF